MEGRDEGVVCYYLLLHTMGTPIFVERSCRCIEGRDEDMVYRYAGYIPRALSFVLSAYVGT